MIYKIFLTFALLFFFSSHAKSQADLEIRSRVFTISGKEFYLKENTKDSTINMTMCDEKHCVPINLNASKTDVESGNFEFENVLLGHLPQFLITAEGNVNICSIVFRLDLSKMTMNRVDFANGELCNYTNVGSFLTSSYRSAATWYIDIYSNSEDSPKLINRNRELNCNTYLQWNPSNPEERRIVASTNSVINAELAIAIVKSTKSILFHEPRENAATHMYLISGDRVSLFDYFLDENNNGWYKIEYHGAKVIKKWIKEKDLGELINASPC